MNKVSVFGMDIDGPADNSRACLLVEWPVGSDQLKATWHKSWNEAADRAGDDPYFIVPIGYRVDTPVEVLPGVVRAYVWSLRCMDRIGHVELENSTGRLTVVTNYGMTVRTTGSRGLGEGLAQFFLIWAPDLFEDFPEEEENQEILAPDLDSPQIVS